MTGIYARVSTEEQARSGYSLQDQIRACRKLADTDEIIEYIDEGISGEILDRPHLTRLRQDIRDGVITRVICLDPDRLSRKLMNQLILSEEIEKKARLVFVNGEYKQTPEGRLFYQLRGAISEFEKAKINERMSRGRREKARQGRVVRDYKVYGYDYDAQARRFVINPFEARVVNMVFRLFTEESTGVEGINGIAEYLTNQGIPTKRGASQWHRQVVRQLLMNRAYIGEFYQNRWDTEGSLTNKFKAADERIRVRERPRDEWILIPCPPIVEPQTFQYAQDLLQESRRRWAGVSKNRYLLSGLVRCGTCGNTMTGRKTKNWGKHIFEYCDLKGTAGAKNRGCGCRVRSDSLEAMVWDVVRSLLSEPSNLPGDDCEYTKAVSLLPHCSEASKVDKRLLEIKKARQNLIHLISVAGGDMGENGLHEARQKLREFKAEEERLTGLREQLKIEAQTRHSTPAPRNLLREAGLYYLSIAPEELTFDDKYHLIHLIVREIIVGKNEIQVLGF